MQSLQELKSINQLSRKKIKEHDLVVLLGKNKLNSNKVLTSKTLIDLYINHDEYISVNKMLRKYNEIKEEIKNPKMYKMVYLSRGTYEKCCRDNNK